MKHNPSQYQLDQAIQRGDTIKIIEISPVTRILNKFVRTVLGTQPNYVYYKDVKYESGQIMIYPKEEAASLIQRDLRCTVHRRDSLTTMENKTVNVFGDINRISLTVDGTVYSFPFDEINTLLTNIQSRYQQALDHPQALEYQELKRLYLVSHKDHEYEYEFINGFKLEILVARNTYNKKYKLFEYSLGLETKEYDTEEEATEDLYDIIQTKIDTLFNNNLCKIEKLIKRKRVLEGNDIKF